MASIEVFPPALAPVEVPTSLGLAVQLDGGHAVQDAVDPRLPGPGQPVENLVAGRGVKLETSKLLIAVSAVGLVQPGNQAVESMDEDLERTESGANRLKMVDRVLQARMNVDLYATARAGPLTARQFDGSEKPRHADSLDPSSHAAKGPKSLETSRRVRGLGFLTHQTVAGRFPKHGAAPGGQRREVVEVLMRPLGVEALDPGQGASTWPTSRRGPSLQLASVSYTNVVLTDSTTPVSIAVSGDLDSGCLLPKDSGAC